MARLASRSPRASAWARMTATPGGLPRAGSWSARSRCAGSSAPVTVKARSCMTPNERRRRLPSSRATFRPHDVRRSNCLVFALRRWHRDGGYLLLRRSKHHAWIPHILWTKSLRDPPLAFVPDRPIEWHRLPWLLRILPLHTVIYRGHVQEGDE